MRLIASCDHLFQMAIFGFYNLISRISMEWGITWSTHLFACHCLHIFHLFLVRGSVASRAVDIGGDADVDVDRWRTVARRISSVPVGFDVDHRAACRAAAKGALSKRNRLFVILPPSPVPRPAPGAFLTRTVSVFSLNSAV